MLSSAQLSDVNPMLLVNVNWSSMLWVDYFAWSNEISLLSFPKCEHSACCACITKMLAG